MAKSFLKNNTGFTLVEVMVAIVVLTIGILGAGAMQVSVLNDNAGSYDMTEATALAQDQVENIMTWDYTDARLNDDNDIPPYNRVGTGAGNLQMRTIVTNGDLIAAVSDNYTVYLDITDNTPVAGSKRIRVDVVWSEGATLRTVSMNYIKLL